MNCAIEWELQRVQAEHPDEHLPLEDILEALHFEEYKAPPFFRRVDVPSLHRPRQPAAWHRPTTLYCAD